MYPKNSATPPEIVLGPLVAVADGSLKTSGASGRIKPFGGSWGAVAGTLVCDATSGIWSYTPTQAETNYVGFLVAVYYTGYVPACVSVVTTASATPGCAGLQATDVSGNVPASYNALCGAALPTGSQSRAAQAAAHILGIDVQAGQLPQTSSNLPLAFIPLCQATTDNANAALLSFDNPNWAIINNAVPGYLLQIISSDSESAVGQFATIVAIDTVNKKVTISSTAGGKENGITFRVWEQTDILSNLLSALVNGAIPTDASIQADTAAALTAFTADGSGTISIAALIKALGLASTAAATTAAGAAQGLMLSDANNEAPETPNTSLNLDAKVSGIPAGVMTQLIASGLAQWTDSGHTALQWTEKALELGPGGGTGLNAEQTRAAMALPLPDGTTIQPGSIDAELLAIEGLCAGAGSTAIGPFDGPCGPLVNVVVTVYSDSARTLPVQGIANPATTTATSQGYVSFNLPSGTFYWTANLTGWGSQQGEVVVP